MPRALCGVAVRDGLSQPCFSTRKLVAEPQNASRREAAHGGEYWSPGLLRPDQFRVYVSARGRSDREGDVRCRRDARRVGEGVRWGQGVQSSEPLRHDLAHAVSSTAVADNRRA